MTNIHVIGQELLKGYEETASRIKKALAGAGLGSGCIVNFWPVFAINLETGQRAKPYGVVCDSDLARGFKTAEVLRDTLDIDVELSRLDAFLPKGSKPLVSGYIKETDAIGKLVGTFIVGHNQRIAKLNEISLTHADCGGGKAGISEVSLINLRIKCEDCGFSLEFPGGKSYRYRAGLRKFVVASFEKEYIISDECLGHAQYVILRKIESR